MSTLCCFQGLLNLLGLRSYPLDLVAKSKLDKVETNSCHKEMNSSTSERSAEYHVNNSNNKNITARSFDDSDSGSSSDSEEEHLQYIIKDSIRRSQSMRSGGGTIASENNEKEGSLESFPNEDESPLKHNLDVGEELNSEEQKLSSQYQGAPPISIDMSEEEPVSQRGFRRKTIRKSRSPSPRSTAYRGNSEWAIEDAHSLYEVDNKSPNSQTEEIGDDMEVSSPYGARVPLGIGDEDPDIQPHEPISACGTLDVAVQYLLSEKKLLITIIEAHDLPSKARGGASIVQVRAVLFPTKKKRYKTKVQHIQSPRFAETFKLSHAAPEDLKDMALRLRMYGIGKVKDRLIGGAVIKFEELNLIRDPQLTIQLQLEPRTDINRVESEASGSQNQSRSSSMMSLSHGGNPPEILLGLSYNPPTGRLCVEVIKGSHFRSLAMTKPPDTFVKLSLLNSSCQEMSQSKTSIRRGQPNPVYKETFFFQVALFQLGEVTLMVSVYNRKTIKKKEMIGWLSMGRNSSSEPDEHHWLEMKEGKGQQVCRWHSLIDT